MHDQLDHHVPIAAASADASKTRMVTLVCSQAWQCNAVKHVHAVQEFRRNVKREYAKLLGLLQAYALISTGVRIVCTNQACSIAACRLLCYAQHTAFRLFVLLGVICYMP